MQKHQKKSPKGEYLLQGILRCKIFTHFQSSNKKLQAKQEAVLSRSEYTLEQKRDWIFRYTGVLGAVIGLRQRLKSSSIADRVLFEDDREARLRALKWREGRFGVRRKCICGEGFTRGHEACLFQKYGIVGREGKVEDEEQDEICDDALWQEVETKKLNANVQEVKVMDYLLGLEDARWKEYGRITLELWDEVLKKQPGVNSKAQQQ